MGIAKQNVDLVTFLLSAKKRFPEPIFEIIKKAYNVAEEAHKNQTRKSGEPYIIHPINVAYILTELGADEKTICAGLLHDTIEDTEYSEAQLTQDFGEEVCTLVKGVTKISKIKEESKSKSNPDATKKEKENQLAENIMKILIASAKDIRVLVIKLADKTHNMRTIKYQPPEKQKIISKEVLEIYSPIAGRLGIYKIKSELEDLAFQVLHLEDYQFLKTKINSKKSERETFIEKIKQVLIARLQEVNIKAVVEGRAKHFYSIYVKMNQKGKTLDDIYDLRALRVITEEERDCYGVLGFIHSIWNPVPGRFKDYIGSPKSNLYQSLHTTVMGPDGMYIEFQIRTREMHETAEKGIAAHWMYKEKKEPTKIGNMWVERLKFLTDSILDPKEFIQEFSTELKEDEIIVFTPKGKIINMPKGSTVLDFAFRIHTDVGLHSKLARIDGRVVSLRTELRSGNQIEIITEKNVKPSPIWLRIVKTTNAKQKLRQYFRSIQESFVASNSITVSNEGDKPKAEEVKLEKEQLELLEKSKKKKVKKTDYKEATVEVAGIQNILIRLSGCCAPLPGDEIIGFITKGRGVSVHKKDCEHAKNFTDRKRMVPVSWSHSSEPIPVRLEVKAKDRQGIYMEIVQSISFTNTNMIEAGATTIPGGMLVARFVMEIEHLDQLQEILDSIRNVKDVIYAERVKSN